jgi:beta-lactam-binding protein with PASTA domain
VGESAVSIALKHVSEPAPAVTSVRPDIHPALDAIVARALVKDPAGRFQSAEEFVLALDDARRAIAAGQPGEHTASYRPVGPPPPPVLPVDRDEDDRGGGKWPFIALGLVILALLGFGAFLLLSKPAQVQVPRVTGLDVERATNRLDRQGLKAATRELRNAKPPGTVIGSDPGQGKKVDEGSTVTLMVSTGPGQVTVPDVTAFSVGRAQKTLAKLRFKYQTKDQSSTDVPKGQVIKTRPEAGATVPYGSRVVIVVSTGPATVQVPKVVGLTRSSAEKALEARKLTVSVTEAASDKPQGEVIAQDPAPTTEIAEGSTVALTVSKGQEQVPVPDVTGRTADEARTILEGAGFRVKVKEQTTGNPLEDGVVLEQRPGTGDQPKGSAVTIIVGRASGTGGGGTPPPPGAGGQGTSTP